MKFGHLLEFHKIPEWYTQYCLYNDHKKRIDHFQGMVKKGITRKLKGYYTINAKGQIYCIDFIKNYKDDVKNKRRRSAKERRRVSILRTSDQIEIRKEDQEPLFASELMTDKKRSNTEEHANLQDDESSLNIGTSQFGDAAKFMTSEDDEAYFPEKMRGKGVQMVGKGKQLESFESKVQKADQENRSSSNLRRGEQLDLIDEAGESDEEDEDLIIDQMIENKLLQQFASITGIDSSVVFARRNTLMQSNAQMSVRGSVNES